METNRISESASLTNGKTKQHKASISPDRSNFGTKTHHLPKINTRYDRGTSPFLGVGRDGHKPSPTYVRARSAVHNSQRFGHTNETEKTDSARTNILEPEVSQSCTLQVRKTPDVLPPISPTSSQHSDHVESESSEGDSVEASPSAIRQTLPPTSSVFQQALFDLKNRRSSNEDPGDLMVRRSSLTSALINMGAITTYPSILEPMQRRRGTIQDDVIVEDVSEHTEPIHPLVLNDEDLKTKRVRANWRKARSKVAYDRFKKAHNTNHEKSVPSGGDARVDEKELTNSEVKSPLKNNKCNSHNSLAIPEDQHDLCSVSSSSSGESSSQSRPSLNWRKTTSIISLKTVGQITRLMSIAGASSCAPGVSSKSSHLLSKPEEGRRLMHRERRDSLRLVKQTLDAIRKDEGDLTEVCGFDELRNCRYLRTRDRSDGRRSSFLGFHEI